MNITNPRYRTLLYVFLFECFAIIFNALLLKYLSHDDGAGSFMVSIIVSIAAMSWNYIFNRIFETVENKLEITQRTILIRATHAILFELGLFVVTVPLYMLWYKVSILKAIEMEIAIMIFFLVFTYLFTWLFDSLFPKSIPIDYQDALKR